jgi:hypothetical protein
LGYLIAAYRNELRKNEKKGLKFFWNRAQRLNKGNIKLKTGKILDQLTQEEMSLLEEAQNGSIKAIQKLVDADPEIIKLPFVAEVMIWILYTYKVTKGPLGNIRYVLWPGFLPERTGGKLHISDKSLRMRLIELMETPVEEVIKDLTRMKILDEYRKNFNDQEFTIVLPGTDLSQLILQIKAKNYITKELACQIIESRLPISGKRLRDIRLRERSGRPHRKIP